MLTAYKNIFFYNKHTTIFNKIFFPLYNFEKLCFMKKKNCYMFSQTFCTLHHHLFLSHYHSRIKNELYEMNHEMILDI